MDSFREALRVQRWDDHRYYHHSRINQSLHLVSALAFLFAYAIVLKDPAVAGLVAWLVAMTSRQIGHFFFEPRDYDVLKVKHGELLARREQAKLAQESEAGTDRIQYQIVEAPRVPMAADGPSRSVLISLVLLVSLASGASFAFVLVHINECFSDPSQLRRAFNLPVLGTVSAVQSAGQRTWRMAEVSTFAGGCALLAMTYGMFLLTDARIAWRELVPPELFSAFRDGMRS